MSLRAYLARGAIQLGEVGGVVAGDAGAAAEIVELEIKHRDLDRRWLGACLERQGTPPPNKPTAQPASNERRRKKNPLLMARSILVIRRKAHFSG